MKISDKKAIYITLRLIEEQLYGETIYETVEDVLKQYSSYEDFTYDNFIRWEDSRFLVYRIPGIRLRISTALLNLDEGEFFNEAKRQLKELCQDKYSRELFIQEVFPPEEDSALELYNDALVSIMDR